MMNIVAMTVISLSDWWCSGLHFPEGNRGGSSSTRAFVIVCCSHTVSL